MHRQRGSGAVNGRPDPPTHPTTTAEDRIANREWLHRLSRKCFNPYRDSSIQHAVGLLRLKRVIGNYPRPQNRRTRLFALRTTTTILPYATLAPLRQIIAKGASQAAQNASTDDRAQSAPALPPLQRRSQSITATFPATTTDQLAEAHLAVDQYRPTDDA